jgi:creatinine amidohydrolase
MTPAELEARLQARPIIYMPCGLIEWHGQHLPLGLDGLKMYHTVLGCAERTGGVVLPLNWIGAPGYGSFCGTLNYEPDFVKDLLKRMMGECAKLGARVIALTTGHYGAAQVGTVKAAAEEFMAGHPGVYVLARPEYEGVVVDGETPADHAGKWETSMALYHFPELVHMENHRPGEEPITRYGDEDARWPEEREPWVWAEDLRLTVSAELGGRAVAAIQDAIVAGVEELCRQAGI